MSERATDALLKDHRMVRKVLEDWRADHPQFEHLTATLGRILRAHAWFEDQIFLPALEAEPLIFQRFNAEIAQEHQDIDALLQQIRRSGASQLKERACYALQLRVLIETHFAKEEDALFPLAEKLLTEEGLIALGDDMKRRHLEVRNVL